jgi:hypothetical protein
MMAVGEMGCLVASQRRLSGKASGETETLWLTQGDTRPPTPLKSRDFNLKAIRLQEPGPPTLLCGVFLHHRNFTPGNRTSGVLMTITSG